jgi:glycosyltransferase involved in cell wall biosynthesis
MPERVRVGFISRTLTLGGAEMLLTQLLEFCDPSRIDWAFLGIYDNDITSPAVRDIVHRHCPTVLQPDIRAACEDCDVIISWGTPLEDVVPPRPRRCKVILMALGMCDFTRHVMSSSNHADSLIAVSQIALSTIPPEELGKARVFPTAVDLRRIVQQMPVEEVRRQWYLRDGQKALVYLGRVAPEKNAIAVARTIAALHRMGRTEWRGVVVGPQGPAKHNTLGYIPDIEGLSEEIAPGLVRFAGPCPEVGSVYAAADHMILPSFIEGNSIALLEMWAAGKPVLATPVGLVAHEHPDFVRRIEPHAMGWEMAQALLADLDDEAGTRERVARARATTIENYSCQALGRRWTEHILAVAAA